MHALLTGSIARSAKGRLFKLLRGWYWGFLPIGATCCTDVCEIWHGGVDCWSPPCQIYPNRYNNKGTPKRNFWWNFCWDLIKMWNINAPVGHIPCVICTKICSVCTPFQDVLPVKILLDLLKGLWSYGGFKLSASGYPQICSAS